MSDAYILDTAGWNYTADITDVLSNPVTQQAAFTGGLLLRRVAGVANAIAALRITENNLLFDFDFTADDGGWYSIAGADSYAIPSTSEWAQYSASVGWVKGTFNGGTNTSPCWIAVDLGASVYMSRLVGVFLASGSSDPAQAAGIASSPDDTLAALNNAAANSGATLDTGAVAAAAERYVRFQVQNDHPTGSITLTGATIYGQKAIFRYSDDNGATETENEIGNYAGENAFDVDDHNAGVVAAAAENKIFYANSYTGAFSELTGLTGVAEGTQITCVRIPYRKLNTQSLNNNASSMQFIFGTGAAVSSKTLWGITLNASSGAIIAQSNMTPTIGSTTYYVIGANALETYGSNTQRVIALCKPVGGGATHLLSSINGGGSWNDLGAADYTRVHFVSPDAGGNGSVITLAGGGGVAVSVNLGSTLQDKIGDFVAELGSDTPLGAFVF